MSFFTFFIKECKSFIKICWYTSPIVGMDFEEANEKSYE